MVTPYTKECSRCGVRKGAEAFPRRGDGNGLASHCRDCRRIADRQRKQAPREVAKAVDAPD